MRTFLLAGFLYLVGAAVILFIKPSLMFTEDGVWKEFGIGRNPATHTWLPFWLFAIIWAIISYIISIILVRNFFSSSSSVENILKQTNRPNNKNTKQNNRSTRIIEDIDDVNMEDNMITKKSMPAGYYVLNTETNSGNGEPSYVYIGKRLPND